MLNVELNVGHGVKLQSRLSQMPPARKKRTIRDLCDSCHRSRLTIGRFVSTAVASPPSTSSILHSTFSIQHSGSPPAPAPNFPRPHHDLRNIYFPFRMGSLVAYLESRAEASTFLLPAEFDRTIEELFP